LRISWICSRSRAICSHACRTCVTASAESGAIAADLLRPSISVRDSIAPVWHRTYVRCKPCGSLACHGVVDVGLKQPAACCLASM